LVLGKDGSLIGFGGKNTNIDGFMPKSISRDGGKTYEMSKTPFQPLGSGQRPSAIRLASGRIFFVADRFDRKGDGPKGKGAFVALSDDEGNTWKTRDLPEKISTVGYTTAAQGPNGTIHIVTSKNNPDFHIELNEAWVLAGGAVIPASREVRDVRDYRENFASGKVKGTWRAGISTDGRFLLDGPQVFYYENGKRQWEAMFRAGQKTGVETWWNADGKIRWQRTYGGDDTWSWRIVDGEGRTVEESRWKGKRLIGVSEAR
jgi:hypothetical protein